MRFARSVEDRLTRNGSRSRCPSTGKFQGGITRNEGSEGSGRSRGSPIALECVSDCSQGNVTSGRGDRDPIKSSGEPNAVHESRAAKPVLWNTLRGHVSEWHSRVLRPEMESATIESGDGPASDRLRGNH